MSADVLKLSHHGSKRGVNLELIERIGPQFVLVSSASNSPQYSFPHAITQRILREARQPLEDDRKGTTRKTDSALGIFYTADRTSRGLCGTIAVVVGPKRLDLWRLQDTISTNITLARLQGARRWVGRVEPARKSERDPMIQSKHRVQGRCRKPRAATLHRALARVRDLRLHTRLSTSRDPRGARREVG
jgi:hypothetical protein